MRFYRLTILVGALIFLAAAVYWPVHQFGFLQYDDPVYVTLNRYVQQGFSRDSLHYAFTTSAGGGWAPLVWISFFLDRQFFGVTAGAMHVENVAWHALGGILLWRLLLQTTGSPGRSWLVAAIFIIHPMHVESVAWVSERKDVLSTALLFMTLLAYRRYCTASSKSSASICYTLMLLLYILSLMTKATGVTLPLLILMMDYWPLRRCAKLNSPAFYRPVMEKVPLCAIALAVSIISIKTQQILGATDAAVNLPITDRAGNAIVCYVIYIAKLFWPTNLAAFYPHPGARPVQSIAAAAGLLGLITWLVFRARGSMPYLLVGWLWFLIALLPTIGLVQIGGQAMADRYSYLPSVGIGVAAIWGAADLLQRLIQKDRAVSASAALAVLIFFAILCRRQVRYWKDTATLFQHSYNVTGPNPVACFQIAIADQQNGDRTGAIEQFTEVVSEDPGNDRAFKFLGDLMARQDLAQAIACYSQAVKLKPEKTDYRIALAATLTRVGNRPSLEEAAQQLDAVLKIDPGNSQAQAGERDLKQRMQKLNSN